MKRGYEQWQAEERAKRDAKAVKKGKKKASLLGSWTRRWELCKGGMCQLLELSQLHRNGLCPKGTAILVQLQGLKIRVLQANAGGKERMTHKEMQTVVRDF